MVLRADYSEPDLESTSFDIDTATEVEAKSLSHEILLTLHIVGAAFQPRLRFSSRYGKQHLKT